MQKSEAFEGVTSLQNKQRRLIFFMFPSKCAAFCSIFSIASGKKGPGIVFACFRGQTKQEIQQIIWLRRGIQTLWSTTRQKQDFYCDEKLIARGSNDPRSKYSSHKLLNAPKKWQLAMFPKRIFKSCGWNLTVPALPFARTSWGLSLTSPSWLVGVGYRRKDRQEQKK